MALIDKILKSVSTKNAAVFTDSALVSAKTQNAAPTDVPMLNVALSGKWNGGLLPGVTILAGPSKHGKTFIGLKFVQAYLNKYDDAVCVFLDSEFGASKTYFDTMNIDTNRIVHIPLTNLEEAKFETVKIMDEMDKNDHIIFFFDSLGNIASKKELEDAQNEKSVADMSRAKQIKSFFRIITPYVNMHSIPFVVINHTYQTTDFIPQMTMSGGTGPLLSADTVFFMGRAQEKDGKDVAGYHFKLKVFKSRFVREGVTFELDTTFEQGIDIHSDLFQFALENGYITSPSKGFYQKADKYSDQKKYRKADFEYATDVWDDIVNDEEFQKAYENFYMLGGTGKTSTASEE